MRILGVVGVTDPEELAAIRKLMKEQADRTIAANAAWDELCDTTLPVRVRRKAATRLLRALYEESLEDAAMSGRRKIHPDFRTYVKMHHLESPDLGYPAEIVVWLRSRYGSFIPGHLAKDDPIWRGITDTWRWHQRGRRGRQYNRRGIQAHRSRRNH